MSAGSGSKRKEISMRSPNLLTNFNDLRAVKGIKWHLITSTFCSLYISVSKGSSSPAPRGREAQAQAEAPGPAPEFVLHGRQVPRLLQDHDRLQPRPDRRPLRRMLHRPLSADRGKGEAHRR